MCSPADTSLAGSAASAAGVLWALACIMPQSSLLPGRFGLGRLRTMHAALGVGAAGVLCAASPAGAGALIGCLLGCLYIALPGFRSAGGTATRACCPRPPPDATSPAAGWSQSNVSQAPPSTQPVMTAPTALTAAEPVGVMPRFSDRERRMSAREYVSEQIDPILDKISVAGLGSLTEEDRRVLAKGREKLSSGKA